MHSVSSETDRFSLANRVYWNCPSARTASFHLRHSRTVPKITIKKVPALQTNANSAALHDSETRLLFPRVLRYDMQSKCFNDIFSEILSFHKYFTHPCSRLTLLTTDLTRTAISNPIRNAPPCRWLNSSWSSVRNTSICKV